MKKIAVIAMGKNTSLAFREQLYRLLGNRVNVSDYYVEGLATADLKADLYLFSSEETYQCAKKYLPQNCEVLVARRSINYHEVNKLLAIPEGTDVLLVNDLISSTYQTIALLQTLGIDHINYHPYSPQMMEGPRLKIAVTPGERELVPDYVEQVIDIKTRLIDITSLVEVLLRLDLLAIYADFLSANYVKDMIALIKESFKNKRLEELVRRKLAKEHKIARYTFAQIVGNSPAISATLKIARKMAESNSTILIQGESGTGKEMIAQGIHNASLRRSRTFIAVNFAAMTESLLESELFGYAEGAFTGARRGGALGLFEESHKGTIFLDEIGDAPLPFQVKLLRVLQERQIRRVGSTNVIPIDVRVIVATNCDLKQLIDAGTFRKDLYYRLNVLPIRIPPLRARGEDIILLARNFYEHAMLERYVSADQYFQWIAPCFLTYDWPGNIRELQNVVEYLMNICPDMPPGPEDLPEEFQLGDQQRFTPVAKNIQLQKNIYETVQQANEYGVPIGRRSLAARLHVPENQIRCQLKELEDAGLVIQQKGCKGLKIRGPENK